MAHMDAVDVTLLASLVAATAYILLTRYSGRRDGLGDEKSKAATKQRHAFRENGICKRMQDADQTVLVVYGSQTGTAEFYARRLAAAAAKHFRANAFVTDAEEVTLADLAELPADWAAIFLAATYGIGEPTDNMLPLFTALEHARGDGDDAALRNLRFALFGLGNKTYSDFCGASRRLDGFLRGLGAAAIVGRGEGDDDGMMEEDYAAWEELLWPALTAHLGLPYDRAYLDVPFEPAFSFALVSRYKQTKLFRGEIGNIGSRAGEMRSIYDAKHPYYAPVLVAEELVTQAQTGAGGVPKSTLHIELDISASGLKYQHGDHLGVFPENAPHHVERLLQRLKVDGEQIVVVERLPSAKEGQAAYGLSSAEAALKPPFPSPATLRDVLTCYLDITAVAKRSLLRVLKDHVADPQERRAVTELASDVEQYEQVVRAQNLSVLDILERFPSIDVALGVLLETLPRIQCRYYSISSSQKSFPGAVHLTVSVLRFPLHAGKLVEGLCTSFLHRLASEGGSPKGSADGLARRVGVYVRRSKFKLPRNKDSLLPVICIGPGSGVAPFRSFVHERDALRRKGKKVGDTHLFFGSQRREADFLYGAEWEQHLNSGSLTSLRTAFSRDQEHKVYVQHRLWEAKEWVWELIHAQSAWIYICGDGKFMAKDVNATLLRIFAECGGMEQPAAQQYLADLTRSGRYHEDVWG